MRAPSRSHLHWRDFSRKDVALLIVGLAVVVATLTGWFVFADAYVKANMGFGPEWKCENPYGKGPICMKKLPTPPSRQK